MGNREILGVIRKGTEVKKESIFNNMEKEEARKLFIWKESPLVWVIENSLKNERGTELEFRKHRFLKDIYDDYTPVQAVRKASQIGFTTMQVLKAIHAAKYRGWSIIYTLPTFSSVQEVVPAKVNALIAQNPILSSWIEDKDSVFQKKVGNGFIYFRGTFSGKIQAQKMESEIGITLTSDLNIADECDRSDQVILGQYESRLAASEYQGRWYFSNPSHPHTLSQKVYEQSDQKHWFIKCKNGHWQYLDFFKNIQGDNFVCQKCQAIITDSERENGQWVQKHKREISGYWISHLMCPWISAKQIQEQYETKDRQYFYNFVLGLPYVGSDQTVNKDTILRCVDTSGTPNFLKGNVLGADSGLKKHWVLGNHQGIFRVGVADSWEEIEDIIKTYDVETAVFDALPDLTEPRKLTQKYPGIVWLNYYKKEVKKADFIKWDQKTRTVYSDRTKIFQQVIDDFINRKIRFQIPMEELGEYVRQWETVYKTQEEDNLGIKRDVWQTAGDDHFAHATNYFRIALERSLDTGGMVKEWSSPSDAYIDPSISPNIQEDLEKEMGYEL